MLFTFTHAGLRPLARSGAGRVKSIDRFLCVLAALGVTVPALPVQAEQPTAQYSVASWGHKDGLPSTFIYSVAQTRDGYLWLGTDDGLVRFDGMQFTRWRPVMPNGELPGQVRVLRVSRQGELLVGTATGLVGSEKNGGLEATQLDSSIQSIQDAADGSLWVATSASLWHLSAGSLEPVEPPIRLPGEWVSGPLQNSDGKEWIATQAGMFYVDRGRFIRTASGHAWLLKTPANTAGWLDGQGNLHTLPDGGIVSENTALSSYAAAISTAMTDSTGCLWVGTRGNGILRIAGIDGRTSVEHYTRSEGLSSDFIRSIFEDKEQNLWVATENGLDRLRRNKVLSLTRGDGLLSDTVTSIAAGSDGSVWLATPKGLQKRLPGQAIVDRPGVPILSLLIGRNHQLRAGTSAGLLEWKDGRETPAHANPGFTAVTALAEDNSGMLWFLDAKKGLFQEADGGDPRPVTSPDLLHQTVTAMVSDATGGIWFGLANGSIVEERQGKFRTWSSNDGLSGVAIHHLSTGSDGELWAATGRGLCWLAGQRFACRNAASGLPGDRVLWALPDAGGNLWLGYNIGVARMNAQQLRESSGGHAELDLKFFDDADGIVNNPRVEGNSPAAFAQDGRLWLTTSQGVAILDPEHLQPNPIPPPVQILGLEADEQAVDLGGPIRLRPLTRDLQFSFTAICLTVPRKVRFRYRLDGFDHAWHDGGSVREASYTNLPPGHYTFRIIAANSDGVWNTSGATLPFFLAPAYFQTLWFWLLCLACVILLTAWLLRLRLRSIQRNLRLRLEERMDERTRIAQELHDHLIQEMVGISMQMEIADELTPAGTKAKTALERALALSRSAIGGGRLTLQSLRRHPVTGSALVESLRQTADAYSEKTLSTVEYRIDGEEQLLHPQVAEDLSELGQEALRNALKYAGRGIVKVRLRFGPSAFELMVRDEGPGMAEEIQRAGIPGHYGLTGMRERAARIAGEFSIISAPMQGTTVQVAVPASRAYQAQVQSGGGRNERRSGKPSEESK
jgi:signal transduction histidine kinase/ligand-binding sensor domain-containing protein